MGKKKDKKPMDYRKMTWMVLKITAKAVTALIVAAIVYLGVTNGYSFGYQLFYSEPLDAKSNISLELSVQEGETVLEIGRELEQNEIISNAYVFWVQAKIFEADIQPGTYMVSPNMSSRDILTKLKSNSDDSLNG